MLPAGLSGLPSSGAAANRPHRWRAALAQLVEHIIRNDGVTCSSHVSGTTAPLCPDACQRIGSRSSTGIMLIMPLIASAAGAQLKPALSSEGTGSAVTLSASQNTAIDQALERLQSDGSYQFEFAYPPPPPRPPQWLADFMEWLVQFTSAFSGLFSVLFWLVVGALVLFMLYMLVPAFQRWIDGLVGRSRLSDAADEGEDWHVDQQRARDLLAEADALAASGRFGDAVRLLLGRSLEDIVARRPGLLKPAMTARAIAIEPALPPPARLAFGELAAIVERALFALRSISADEWQNARSAYAQFALRDQWSGSAASARS
jgi:hypothetical protein